MKFYKTSKIETNSALSTGVKCDCENKTFTIRMGRDWIELMCTKCKKIEYIDL